MLPDQVEESKRAVEAARAAGVAIAEDPAGEPLPALLAGVTPDSAVVVLVDDSIVKGNGGSYVRISS